MHVLKLIFKNTLRHKLRTLLTICGLAIAVIAFATLHTVLDMWNEGVKAAAVDRLIARHSVSFIFPLPYSYKNKIAQIDGIEYISFANWFQGVYKDKESFFARMAVDAETYFDVYPEFVINPNELATFKRERNSCIVGSGIAKDYGFKIGDNIRLEGDIYPGQWDFVVRGIYTPKYPSTDVSQMVFHWEYLDERIKQETPFRAGHVGWYIIKIKDEKQSGKISQQIDNLFENSPETTKTETERAFTENFMSGLSSLFTLINFVSYVIIGILMLVLGNTMIMSARERTREYAVLKTLGFSKLHLTGLIFGEAFVIAVMGAAVGITLTYPIVSSIEQNVPKGYFPFFYVTESTLILAASIALFVAFASSVFPIFSVLKKRIVDGLRFVG